MKPRIRSKTVLTAAAVAMATLVLTNSSHVSAALIDLVSVDFNNATSPTEAGFVGQSATSDTHTTTLGDLTVAISNQQGNFDRGVTGGTNMDLYRDFFFKNASTGGLPAGTMFLTLSGPALSANTDYELTLYAYDSGDGSHSTSFTGTSGTIGSAGPILNKGTGDPDSLGEYGDLGTFTSDGSGMLTISITDSGSRPRINGFEISVDVVPEPSAFTLSALALLSLGFVGWRQRRR